MGPNTENGVVGGKYLIFSRSDAVFFMLKTIIEYSV